MNVDTALALVSAPVVEFFHDEDWWQVAYAHNARGRGSVVARWRHKNARSWSAWGQPWEPEIMLNLPARIVPQNEMEADPNNRGPIQPRSGTRVEGGAL